MKRKGVATDLQKSAHAVYRAKYHLVWIPKYRRKLLTGEAAQYLEKIFHGIAERYDVAIDTMSIQSNHVHIFVSFPPKYSISYVIKIFKGVSSWHIRKAMPEIDDILWGADFWAPGFYASTVNDKTTAQQIRRYIQNQEHAKRQPMLFPQ